MEPDGPNQRKLLRKRASLKISTSTSQDSVHQISSPSGRMKGVATKASVFAESIFGHMFADSASAAVRRRAMTLVDVLVERHSEGQMKLRWILVSLLLAFCYMHYILPVYAAWGTRRTTNSMNAGELAETVGGPYSQVSFGVLFLVTLIYLFLIRLSTLIMETRLPVKTMIFEMLAVHNMYQTLLNSYVCIQLLIQARASGFEYPWGNALQHNLQSHSLGYFIWFHYHLCQIELFDTFFMVLRKNFRRITYLHVLLRVLSLWGWFFACRFACGGDTYFPAAITSGTRAVVYAYYSLSIITLRGVPFLRRAPITRVQTSQFFLCVMHAAFCLYKFWDMENLFSSIMNRILILYLVVVIMSLGVYTDFHSQAAGKSETIRHRQVKVNFSFDSSGWLYCYHFGAAAWLRDHLVPVGLTPEDAATAKFPTALNFSGSSGGSLVASVLSMGLQPAKVFEMVLEKQPECKRNPFRMLPAVEAVASEMMPANAWRSLTGRLRVILTRLSFRYPFFTAEVVNRFNNNQDVFNAMRGSCHVPLIGGLGPYCYDGNAYFDGMFWPTLLVPWRGSRNDFVIRVSALSSPTSDIKPPMLSAWWTIFPPDIEVCRGMFWLAYRDTARWFANRPGGSSFELCACRKTAEDSSQQEKLRNQRSEDPSLSTWLAACELILQKPSEKELPEVDPVTGKDPRELIEACTKAIARDRWRLFMLLLSVCSIASLSLLWGFLA